MTHRTGRAARGRFFGARWALGLGVLALVVLATAGVSSASAAAMFTQCPPVGSDTGCGFLVTIGPGGTATVAADPAQGPYEGIEDTLVGVQNNSGQPVNSVFLSASTTIFGFELDGICDPTNGGSPTTPTTPPGCSPTSPFGKAGDVGRVYEGPNNTFVNIATDTKSGTVLFTKALPNGGSAYFGLEEALQVGQLKVPPVRQLPPTVKVTPKVPACSATGKITLAASETGANATGIQSITYRIDSGAQHTVLGSKFTVTLPNGKHKLTFSATDKAFNTSSPKTVTVKVDKVHKCKKPKPPVHHVAPHFTG